MMYKISIYELIHYVECNIELIERLNESIAIIDMYPHLAIENIKNTVHELNKLNNKINIKNE